MFYLGPNPTNRQARSLCARGPRGSIFLLYSPSLDDHSKNSVPDRSQKQLLNLNNQNGVVYPPRQAKTQIYPCKPPTPPPYPQRFWTECLELASISIQTREESHTRYYFQISRRFLQTISHFIHATLLLRFSLSLSLFVSSLSLISLSKKFSAAMAQVVATRLIHGSFVSNPASGSLQSRAESLKPSYGFAAKVLAQAEKRNRLGAVHVTVPITARRSTRAEPEVVPVSPEDVPKVFFSYLFFAYNVLVFLRTLIYLEGQCLFVASLVSFFWERASFIVFHRVTFWSTVILLWTVLNYNNTYGIFKFGDYSDTVWIKIR